MSASFCPSCGKPVKPPLSSGRQVCTGCGWKSEITQAQPIEIGFAALDKNQIGQNPPASAPVVSFPRKSSGGAIGLILMTIVAGYFLFGSHHSPTSTYASPSEPIEPLQLLISIPAIAGKSRVDVESIIGPAESCTPSSELAEDGVECIFTKDQTEITFINGKADWISVDQMSDIPYSPSALEAIGLPVSEPTHSTENIMTWEHTNGFLEILIFPNGHGKVHYALVKVSTP